MIITMITVHMVQMTIDQVVDVIAVWKSFVATIRSMDVVGIVTDATMRGCTCVWVGR
tara:strand:- start:302 stop:472 length:171 start_codon:yes stop_codon:yes gene_type:complete